LLNVAVALLVAAPVKLVLLSTPLTPLAQIPAQLQEKLTVPVG
jgi:hypothetical protein